MSVLAIGISLKGRYILLEDDSTLPIIEMLDDNGEETSDVTKCRGVIFQNANGTYSVVDMHRFEAEHLIDKVS